MGGHADADEPFFVYMRAEGASTTFGITAAMPGAGGQCSYGALRKIVAHCYRIEWGRNSEALVWCGRQMCFRCASVPIPLAAG